MPGTNRGGTTQTPAFQKRRTAPVEATTEERLRPRTLVFERSSKEELRELAREVGLMNYGKYTKAILIRELRAMLRGGS